MTVQAQASSQELARAQPTPAPVQKAVPANDAMYDQGLRILETDILPKMRQAAGGVGYLAVSRDGGDFKMETINSAFQLETLIADLKAGRARYMMAPPTMNEVVTAKTVKETPKQEVPKVEGPQAMPTVAPVKQGLVSRLKGMFGG